MKRILLLTHEELHVHEAVDSDQVQRIVKMMRETGMFHPPLLVDDLTRVILDGHHRYWASQQLGCRRIPCYCVDYLNDDDVVLKSWRPDVNVTKQQVIDRGLGESTYPLKTTRHLYELPQGIVPVPLARLLDGD